MNTYKFIANIIIRGKIELLTGMHVGGSKDKLEIGGVDSPVIRNPQNRFPYIPGSSLKGKLRSLLEYSLGVVGKEGDVSDDERIVRIFGIGANEKEISEKDKNYEQKKYLKNIGPTRLIVRDAIPDEKTKDMWKKIDSELLYTEYKPENTINRITAAANPRFIERVVEGSKFDFEIVFGIYQMNENDTNEKMKQDLDNLLQALRLLEHSFVGGSGSRGYGKIKFHVLPIEIVKADDYKTGSEAYKNSMLSLPKEIEKYSNLPLSIQYAE
jgi:CRISPR-associated protein Csm3